MDLGSVGQRAHVTGTGQFTQLPLWKGLNEQFRRFSEDQPRLRTSHDERSRLYTRELVGRYGGCEDDPGSIIWQDK